MRPTVYFSNQIEQLALYLGHNLFKKGADPFSERLVVFPSQSLKLYLTSFFASHPDWKISMGVTFKTLLNAALYFYSEEEKKAFLSPLGLSFLLEESLEQLSQQEQDPEFIHLYFPKSETKTLWLAEQLTRLFSDLGTFEAKALTSWKQSPNWKTNLWDKTFSKVQCLSTSLLDLEVSKDCEVHLFGFSQIPAHLLEFFSLRAAHIYFLSPSPHFWEDLCSDQQRIYLEKKMEGNKVKLQVQQQMSMFLQNSHPLLGNWGAVGRGLLAQLGDIESYLEESYFDPAERPSSALASVQSGLFDLESPDTELEKSDTSIVFFSATSKLREVEALYETLAGLMQKDQSLEPKDILVLSASLESYFPYIQMVFGSAESQIDYSVHGIGLAFSAEESRALMHLFTLAESSFALEEVLDFLSFPSVRRKFDLSLEDLELLRRWLKSAYVQWGFDEAHRKRSLDSRWPEGSWIGTEALGGSWEEGLTKLLYGLALDSEHLDSPQPWPQGGISYLESELLGRCIAIVCQLYEDFKPVRDRSRLTIRSWCEKLIVWAREYFEAGRVIEAFSTTLQELAKELEDKVSGDFGFNSCKKVLESYFFQKKESFQSSHLNAVKFQSMELGGSYPSKVLCALGCDEASFPRATSPSFIEKEIPQKEAGSIFEQDRYLFLEMLLNARQTFICSYLRISEKDQKEQGPSLLIQDLMSELDSRCSLKGSSEKPSKVFTLHHPQIPFDRSYFTEEKHRSFVEMTYRAALSYYSVEKSPMSVFSSTPLHKDTDSGYLEIKHLQEFAKDPARFFLQRRLGIYFDFVGLKEEEFSLSALPRSQMQKAALDKGFSAAFAQAKGQGRLPQGRLGELSVQELSESFASWNSCLEKMHVDLTDIYSYELSLDAKDVSKDNRRIIAPALELCLEEGKGIQLFGTIERVTPKGLLALHKDTKKALWELYPSLLILSCLSDSSKAPSILCVQKQKKVTLNIDDPIEALKKYITLFSRALQEPCLIRPESFFSLLDKESGSKKSPVKFSPSAKGWIDPYEQWLYKRGAYNDPQKTINAWHKDWEEAFSPLLSAVEESF